MKASQHPINKVFDAEDFVQACDAVVAGATFEMCEAAKDVNDGLTGQETADGANDTFGGLRANAHRAKAIYVEELAAAVKRATLDAEVRLRQEGLDEFADALESGDYSILAF